MTHTQRDATCWKGPSDGPGGGGGDEGYTGGLGPARIRLVTHRY